MKSDRLDHALVQRGLCPSREKAKRLVLAGQVRVNGQVAHKASEAVDAGAVVAVEAPEKYVSRGGLKLERALEVFALEVRGRIALDVGASTGGFTDCLLQHGAVRVFAVDVGRGQLAWKLRQDQRVCALEGLNARHLTAEVFPTPFVPVDLATIDCAFISLRLVLPPVAALVRPGGSLVGLVKPQFEAGRAEASRGQGVITDPAVHRRVLGELEAFVGGLGGLRWRAVAESPILGPAGNKEFLALIEKVT
jgi:23S rRNA (cytidine1920-2'-O)/16S rRNA (cytidine1409-2'-O)-methyltransferase